MYTIIVAAIRDDFAVRVSYIIITKKIEMKYNFRISKEKKKSGEIAGRQNIASLSAGQNYTHATSHTKASKPTYSLGLS